MSRFVAVLCLFFVLIPPTAEAQVIECPGALPAARLDQDQTLAIGERLLGRFSAALGLHGLDMVDEPAILLTYQDRPEQLLTKLTYLTLQCQMVLLDSGMPADARKRAVRRVFLDYVLRPADPGAASLAAYVNAVATNGKASEDDDVQEQIERIEQDFAQSARQQWAAQWFLTQPPDAANPRPWSVIIASPRFEDDGWQALRRNQAAHPDIHFELDGPFDLDSPHYAIVAGRGLDQTSADQLLARVKEKGLPEDSYVWRPPLPEGGNGA